MAIGFCLGGLVVIHLCVCVGFSQKKELNVSCFVAKQVLLVQFVVVCVCSCVCPVVRSVVSLCALSVCRSVYVFCCVCLVCMSCLLQREEIRLVR